MISVQSGLIDEEKFILRETATNNGSFLVIDDYEGFGLQFKGELLYIKEGRERSKIEYALKRLIEKELLEKMGKNLYRLTNSGWQASDSLTN